MMALLGNFMQKGAANSLLKKRGGNKKSGSSDSEEFDMMAIIRDECGLDPEAAFENLAPVDPGTVTSAFTSLATYAAGASSRLQGYRAQISAAAAATDGADLETLYNTQRGLYEGFNDEMGAVGVEGICVGAEMWMLAMQMEVMGTSGFAADDRCQESITMVKGLDEKVFWESPEDQWFHDFGTAMRSDMDCFINTTVEFKDYSATLAAEVATYTPRQVTVAVTGLQTYSNILGREIGKMMFAVEVVAKLLEGHHGLGGEEKALVEELKAFESLLKK